jgi:selenocysteine lyase/cysteine desulfurase
MDVVVGAAYKHLLCPRGVAFMRVGSELWPKLMPWTASWRSVQDPYANFYGGTLDDLAPSAARFDVSLAWHSWIGARESLRFLLRISAEVRRSWCVGLAARLAERLGIVASGSSILGVPISAGDRAGAALSAAGIIVSMPAGSVRVSFHVYNKSVDVDEIARVLGPFVV